MTIDHIRYDILTQDALRGVVRTVLEDAARNGLPGEHHFYVAFDTRADGVKLSQRMRTQYPEEMTVVLQHQFWDLVVTDDQFEVGLSFGGVPERVVVPFAAIKSFVDPSVQFGVQFEMLVAAEDAEACRRRLRQAGASAGRASPHIRSRRRADAGQSACDRRAARQETAGQETGGGAKGQGQGQRWCRHAREQRPGRASRSLPQKVTRTNLRRALRTMLTASDRI